VVKTGLKFTLASGGCRDIHSSLATSQNHVFLLGRNRGAVKGGVGNIGLENGEVTGGDKLGSVSVPFMRLGMQGSDIPWRTCLWRR
jgi:hypothetical protein